jgi:hypothetical protein
MGKTRRSKKVEVYNSILLCFYDRPGLDALHPWFFLIFLVFIKLFALTGSKIVICATIVLMNPFVCS